MKRNTTTLYLQSPGATTPIPWVNDAPDFSAFTEPTLSVLQKAWNDFQSTGEPLEIIPDPEPVPEPIVPDWDSFNAYMLIDPTFKSYRNTVNALDSDLTPALFNAYSLILTNGYNAFSLVWNQWVNVSGITNQDKSTIAATASSFNLPAEFIAIIEG